MTVRLVLLADTHMRPPTDIPDGDVLIHAGDLTMSGSNVQMDHALGWMAALPHPHKVLVAGNHDWYFWTNRERLMEDNLLRGMTYLCDSGAEILGLRFWGSPWQPEFGSWAFNLPRGAKLRAKWKLIPRGTDVLMTHSPPHGILDATAYHRLGCEELTKRVAIVRPKLHVFGHIHEAYGQIEVDGTTFVNAAICDADYDAIRDPVVIDLD